VNIMHVFICTLHNEMKHTLTTSGPVIKR
jgi:hypothetical protein